MHIKTNLELEESNQTAKFWELETPEVLCTPKNTFRHYPESERLVVHLPDYPDRRSGEAKLGKGVGINLASLKDTPNVLLRLIDILRSLADDATERIKEDADMHD